MCKKILILALIITSFLLVNTTLAGEKNITLGLIQKYIKPGDSQVNVIEVIGSPNIITKDKSQKETWIYDKIYTKSEESDAKFGIGAAGGVLGWASRAIGGLGLSFGKNKRETQQKTLTTVIKFDSNNCVEAVNYHTSRY